MSLSLATEIDRFAARMKAEKLANDHKGDLWLEMDPRLLVNDALYHAAKFSIAMKEGPEDKLEEYAADVAVLMLMALERWKILHRQQCSVAQYL